MLRATVKKKDEKTYALMLGDHEIGVSKLDSDARMHMHEINDALEGEYERGYQDGDEAYEEGYETGYQDGIDFVATGE